jgi:hypothetical protein
MRNTSWPAPVRVLIQATPASVAGLWSLLSTGALAAAELALLPGLDDDLHLTLTSADLHEAAEHLTRHHLRPSSAGAVLDLAPAPSDDVPGCREALDLLLTTAMGLTEQLQADPQISTSQRSALTQIRSLLEGVHHHLAGRLQ